MLSFCSFSLGSVLGFPDVSTVIRMDSSSLCLFVPPNIPLSVLSSLKKNNKRPPEDPQLRLVFAERPAAGGPHSGGFQTASRIRGS